MGLLSVLFGCPHKKLSISINLGRLAEEHSQHRIALARRFVARPRGRKIQLHEPGGSK